MVNAPSGQTTVRAVGFSKQWCIKGSLPTRCGSINKNAVGALWSIPRKDFFLPIFFLWMPWFTYVIFGKEFWSGLLLTLNHFAIHCLNVLPLHRWCVWIENVLERLVYHQLVMNKRINLPFPPWALYHTSNLFLILGPSAIFLRFVLQKSRFENNCLLGTDLPTLPT